MPAASPYKILEMSLDESPESSAAEINRFTAEDVASILRERGWLAGELSPAQAVWCEHAASLLGPHAAERSALAELLGLVFHYDAREILARVDSHAVLSRYGAREVLRELALLLLEGGSVTSDRFKEIVNHLKTKLAIRGRELFHLATNRAVSQVPLACATCHRDGRDDGRTWAGQGTLRQSAAASCSIPFASRLLGEPAKASSTASSFCSTKLRNCLSPRR